MTEGIFKVRLYGDSLALPRPGYLENNARYISLLCAWWMKQEGVQSIELCDRSKGSSTVADLYQWYEHDNVYFGETGDVLIIHCGIVDCAPRPVPRWLRNRIARLPGALRRRTIDFLHQHRAQILERSGGWRHIDPQLFRSIYKRWMEHAVERFSRVYIINIAPTNDLTEKHSPGFTQSIAQYNEIISDIVSALSAENLFLIDVHKIINEKRQEIDDYIVPDDGHHITALSHRIYCREIQRREERFFQCTVRAT
jgi:hypothetical protein